MIIIYQSKGSAGGGAVDSVFGRTGAVVAVSGDYDVTELSTDTWGGGNFARVAVAGGLEEISPAALAAVLGSDINILNLDSFGVGIARYIRTDGIDGESLEGRSAAQVLGDIGAQPLDAGLTDLAGLSPADGNIPVGDGANWVAESGATARASLGAADTAAHLVIAASDEDSDLAIATPAVTFRMPFAMTLTEVRANVGDDDAPTGSALQADINEGGVSILSTKLTIDAGDTTSEDATTPPVISDTALADNAIVSIDIDAVGSGNPGKGLKITFIGTRP